MTRHQQFEYIELARQSVLAWASARGIPLARVEFVVPFVATDFSLSAWLFYKTDHDVTTSEASGVTAEVRKAFLAVLGRTGYSQDWIGKVSLVVDSCENVDRNYQGSYFYRLR